VSERVAIVTPWFGKALKGGAEQIAHQIATRLAARGHAIEVLTTCCGSFQEEWSKNRLPAGRFVEDGVEVVRFPVARRDRRAFDAANRELLGVERSRLRPGISPVSDVAAAAFVRENIHSPPLLDHLEQSRESFRAVVFLPYLYGTTLAGVRRVPERAWLHPCLHDEAYAYLPEVAEVFASAQGLLFNSEGEAELAAHLYGPSIWPRGTVVGAGIEVEGVGLLSSSQNAVVERAGKRFALYLGRRDASKGVDVLVEAYRHFRRQHPDTETGLVLAGPGPALAGPLPRGVLDLGLVDEKVKVRLLESCVALLQPSVNESYSRVMMEAWHVGRPVVVHTDCAATAGSVTACGGGLLAGSVSEWTEVLERLEDPAQDQVLRELGRAGQRHAREVADWDRVIDRYERGLGLGATPRAHALRSSQGLQIHQLLPTLAAGDAIGNHARFLRQSLQQQGIRSEIFASSVDPRCAHEGTPFRPSHLRGVDGVIYHHSIGSELTALAASHKGPKLLVYHNVTPGNFFEPYRPEFAELLEQGRANLPTLASSFPHAVADSHYNAKELLEAGFRVPEVLPVPVDPRVFTDPPDPAWMRWLGDGSVNLLFVGQVGPHKRQDHLIAAFAHVLRRVPEARLVLAGAESPSCLYGRCLRELATRLGVASRVFLPGPVTQAQLHACYRSAALYWSMSEHEGFGVPLIEAMWFDVPVLAYGASAVPETLGEGGLVFSEKRFDLLALLVERLCHDPSLREKVLHAQRRRRVDFLPGTLEDRYRGVVASLLAR
jgi:glycosyltransferase involved in cell wall biosynthesis